MEGIDVSHHNGVIDWSRVRDAGKDFAILKAMYEGSHKPDECFEYNYLGAHASRLNVGAYIFIGSRSIQNPEQDAHAFLDILGGRTLECGVWIDAESDALRSLGNGRVANIILKEAEIIREGGYRVGVYTNLDWYRNVLTERVKSSFPIWMARYPKADMGILAPTLSPSGIAGVVAWQYSSKGKIPGIQGNVDLDIDFGGIVTKSDLEVAHEVIDGKWGTAHTVPTRRERLTAAGYDYGRIQKIVNKLLTTHQ